MKLTPEAAVKIPDEPEGWTPAEEAMELASRPTAREMREWQKRHRE